MLSRAWLRVWELYIEGQQQAVFSGACLRVSRVGLGLVDMCASIYKIKDGEDISPKHNQLYNHTAKMWNHCIYILKQSN